MTPTRECMELSGFFFSSRRRHTRSLCDWSSDVCSSDLNSVSAMRPHPLPETELWQVVAFLRSINSPDSTSGAVGHGAGRSLDVNVSYDELAATREPAEDWLTYSVS